MSIEHILTYGLIYYKIIAISQNRKRLKNILAQNARMEVSMDERYEKAKEVAEKYNQEHLLNCYESLDDENKKILLNQILHIDFEQVADLYEKTKKAPNIGGGEIKSISYIDKNKLSSDRLNEYRRKGKNGPGDRGCFKRNAQH